MNAPLEVTAAFLRTIPLPKPEEGGKDKRGRVLIIAGSDAVPGAAVLCATAAYRAGAGRVRIGTAARVAVQIAIAVPEAMVLALPETDDGGIDRDAGLQAFREQVAACDALLLGPGMDQDASAIGLAADLCAAATAPVVLDAIALKALQESSAGSPDRKAPLIITPHAGEMARLLAVPREEIERDPLKAARLASERWRCVVVLKGARTHIVEPTGGAWVFTGGSVGLATSGSGDVLAGLIAALVARGSSPAEAALWGVFLHGEAGRRLAEAVGPLGFLAREIPGEVPQIMRAVCEPAG